MQINDYLWIVRSGLDAWTFPDVEDAVNHAMQKVDELTTFHVEVSYQDNIRIAFYKGMIYAGYSPDGGLNWISTGSYKRVPSSIEVVIRDVHALLNNNTELQSRSTI